MGIRKLLAATAILLSAAAPAIAQPAVADPVAAMKAGKELFEKSCKLCHGLDRALAPSRDAAAWELVLKRMVAYGTPLNVEQRALVLRYLGARSTFAARCAGCHELTRVVGDKPGARDWKALTARMAGHVLDFEKQGKPVPGGAFTPQELNDIAALLQVVIP
jgi:mono/diheme cytochrome c family protein